MYPIEINTRDELRCVIVCVDFDSTSNYVYEYGDCMMDGGGDDNKIFNVALLQH